MNKRAAMQMAISTIVLMVLALLLIGIVIGSFTGMFSASEEKLMRSLSLVDASVKATSSDVLAGGDAYRFARNKNQIFTLSFYNNGHDECAESAEVIFNCPEIYYSFTPLLLPIPIGEESTLGGVIKMGSRVPKGNYVCSIKIRCGSMDPSSPNQIIVAEQHSVFEIS